MSRRSRSAPEAALCALPVMKVIGIRKARTSRRPRPIAASPTGCSSTPSRPRGATRPGGNAVPSTGRPRRPRSGHAVDAVGRARSGQCRRGGADDAAAGGRCLLRRRVGAGAKDPTSSRRSSRRAGGGGPSARHAHPPRQSQMSSVTLRRCDCAARTRDGRWPGSRAGILEPRLARASDLPRFRCQIAPAMTDTAQHLPRRPRRARLLRHLWRPLRRRDADAADPRTRSGL